MIILLLLILLVLPIIAFFTLVERKVIASVQRRREGNLLLNITDTLLAVMKHSKTLFENNYAAIKGLVRFSVSLIVRGYLIGYNIALNLLYQTFVLVLLLLCVYYLFLMFSNTNANCSTFELFYVKLGTTLVSIYSFVVYEPITPSLVVLVGGLFMYLYGLNTYELFYTVHEVNPPMEGIIDLHHDILFFLIFIILFLWWMISTIVMYFNDKVSSVHVHSEPASASLSLGALLWKVFYYVVGLIMFVALTISYSWAHPLDYVDPSIEVPDCSNWRVKTFNEFRTKTMQMISVKHVTASHAENLWTFMNVNADYARAFTADPEHHKLLQFIHFHQEVFVGLKPFGHTSLHTAVSEAVHVNHLYKHTGKLPCKLNNESISKGGDFAILNEVDEIEDVYQAKTLFGNRQTPAAVSGFINGASPVNGVNGLSVIVSNSEDAAEINRRISPQIGITRVTVSSIDNISEHTIRSTFNKMMSTFTAKSYDQWMDDVTKSYMKKFVTVKDSNINNSNSSSNINGSSNNSSNIGRKK